MPPSTQDAFAWSPNETTAGLLALAPKSLNDDDPTFWKKFDPALQVAACTFPAAPETIVCQDGGVVPNVATSYTVYLDPQGEEVHRITHHDTC